MQTAETINADSFKSVNPSPILFFRFFKKVKMVGHRGDKCWIWNGGISANGCGMIGIVIGSNKKIIKSSQLSWMLFKGAIPAGKGYHGTCVCHRCDNPLCVNPDHLFLGSQKDNLQDCSKKGRTRRGILSFKNVKEIRNSYVRGKITLKSLADKFGVGISAVHHVLSRKIYPNG